MKNITGKILLVISIMLFISACTASPTTEPLSPADNNIQQTELPQTVTPEIPEPGPGESTITGVIQVKGEPLSSEVLYLADIVYTDAKTPYLAGFDRNVNIKTQTDDEGRFVFLHVPSDEMYALILDRFSYAIMLKNPGDGKDLLFTPSDREILELGLLNYDSLLEE